MKFIIIHNNYSVRGGEEVVVEFQKNLLEKHGHEVVLYSRSYSEMETWALGKFGGMFTSVFNFRSLRDLKRLCNRHKFDAALIHNVFPIISPAVIPFLRRKGIRVLQVVHNYRLFCPIGTFYRRGEICEACLHTGREWNCFRNRCTGGVLASFSFAAKFWLVRLLGYYRSVDRFLCLNRRQAGLLSQYMKADKKTVLLPNAVGNSGKECDDASKRRFVSFVGRLEEEKGFPDFLRIAEKMPEYEFRVAGAYTEGSIADLPKNVTLCGFLRGAELDGFYAESRVVLFLSKWYEGFGLVAAEAMKCGTPVVVYDISVASDIVEEEKSGFVVPTGDIDTVVERVKILFEDKDLFERFSAAAKQRVEEEYSAERYYERLMKSVVRDDE